MLYVHIPYCHHKCSYCAFFSVAGKRDMELYVEALCMELKQRCREVGAVETIYFGGGTPTRLGINFLRQIVETIRADFDLHALTEATVEANPEDLTPEFLAKLQELNFFNRLSIGVQSFIDRDLKAINRVHTSAQAQQALNDVGEAGFKNVSIDLIMGLPGQSISDWSQNLDIVNRLIDRGLVKHLSCYELTVEEGTILQQQLRQGRVILPDEDTVASEYDLLQAWCHDSGMRQYEVSNYSLPGWHSRHNSRYWQRVPYLGTGAGAHSFDGQRRRWNLNDIKAYINGAFLGEVPCEEEILSAADAVNEYLMTSLRTNEGIEKKMLRSLMPEAYDKMSVIIRGMVSIGLIEETSTHFVPTSRGILQADAIAANLFL